VGAIAEGVQISLITFAIAGFFHPVAYQFYFFCIAGLAVALKNTCRAQIAREYGSSPAATEPVRPLPQPRIALP
jgi:hypothetical protein